MFFNLAIFFLLMLVLILILAFLYIEVNRFDAVVNELTDNLHRRYDVIKVMRENDEDSEELQDE